jgi:hypothetical protein
MQRFSHWAFDERFDAESDRSEPTLAHSQSKFQKIHMIQVMEVAAKMLTWTRY